MYYNPHCHCHHTIGFDFHIKGGLPMLFCQVSYQYIAGSFATKIKDWFVQQRLRVWFEPKQRDLVRENTIDELTSLIIWGIVLGLVIETLSLKLGVISLSITAASYPNSYIVYSHIGFALGSLLTLGGIGSASLVLALRGTMEDIIGGVALKIHDKFRIGEQITLPGKHKDHEEGVIEALSYMETKVRRMDNSIITIPNRIFSNGEVINWSRTPYRHFKTTVSISNSSLKALPVLINELKAELGKLEGIESKDRELIVAASGFENDKIIIEISLHFVSSNSEETARLRTSATDLISRVINAIE
jgi:small-conductance mechanosensitive channel